MSENSKVWRLVLLLTPKSQTVCKFVHFRMGEGGLLSGGGGVVQ